MTTLSTIKARRSVRDWTDKDIDEATLLQILEAARFAPSPLNSQPWHFIVVKKKETIEYLAKSARHGSFLAKANVLIIITADNNAEVDQWLNEHNQHIYSAVCAAENIWLAATELGIGVCWISLDEKITREYMAIPQSHLLIGSLALGYPAKEPMPHLEAERKHLSEIVSREKFDK